MGAEVAYRKAGEAILVVERASFERASFERVPRLATVCGFLVAFLVYSQMNLFIHSGLRFRGPLSVFNAVTASHFRHHMLDVNRNFASLSPSWDIVFGTHQPVVAASPFNPASTTPHTEE